MKTDGKTEVKVAYLITLIASLLDAAQEKSRNRKILFESHVEEVAIANHLGVICSKSASSFTTQIQKYFQQRIYSYL